MKLKTLAKELARDLIALGGPIFFILVLARVLITENFAYLSQFLIAGILFLLPMLFLKANMRAGLGIILLIFTSGYYNNLNFTIFATALYFAFLFSLFYLRNDAKEIIKGTIFGLTSAGAGYYAAKLIFG